MNLENIWQQWNKRQLEYLTDIVSHSNAETFCEIGAFCGSVAREVWKGIEQSDKEFYLIDNYAFLPEKFRSHFFKLVKKTISDDERIHTILEDSHVYDWTKHDFVIFSHADYDHWKKDFQRLIDSDVKFVVLDIYRTHFQVTAMLLDAINQKKLTARYWVEGMLICGQDTHCSLPTEEGMLLGQPIRYAGKVPNQYQSAVDSIVEKLPRVNNF